MSEVNKCVILGPAYPLRGGIAHLNESLAKAFSANGIDTTIYSFSLQYPSFLFPGKTQKEEGGSAPKGLDIRTEINSVNPFNWLLVANRIIKEKPELIVVRYWMPFMAPCLGSILRKVKKNINVKIVGLTDNVIAHEPRFGDRTLTQYFLNSCDSFVAMSQSVLNDLAEFDKAKPRKLIHHPIYNQFGDLVSKTEARNELGLNLNGKYLMFFGLIRRYKGLDLLIEALAQLPTDLTEVKLLVAGEFYEQEQEIDRRIEELGLKDRVILARKFIPSDKVRYYFCAADLVVQPYITATQSGVTQIAYHYNKAMIVTDVGGLPEMVPHNKVGFVVSPKAKQIADSIAEFYHENKEAEFSANAKTEKERFSWEAMVNGIVSLSAA